MSFFVFFLPSFLPSCFGSVVIWRLTRADRGMQTVWVFGNSSEVLDRVPRPEVEGYLTYGGSVNGNESHYPEVVHFDDLWAQEQ